MKPFEVALLAVGSKVGMMTGSTLLKDGDDALIIAGLKASKKYKSVSIVYDRGLDLFDMTFVRKRSNALETVKNVYVEDIRSIFESKTGLFTSL